MNSKLKFRISPAGLHIFNRATGLNVLIDEFHPNPKIWSKAPRQVSIALTYICDLACPHCYAPKNNFSLPFIQLIGWLRELDENGCIGVGFGGGEPTLYPRIVDLCSYAAKSTNLAVTMTTHGHRFSDELIDALAGNVHFIRFSMDGVDATYESIRGRSFHALLQRIEKVSEIARFGINFVVNSKTIDDLDYALEIAVQLNATEFLLLPEVPVGKGSEIDVETSKKLIKWVREYRGNLPLTVSEYGADGLPTCDPLIAEQGLYSYAHITASGELRFNSYAMKGVKISDKGVIEALDKLREKEFRNENLELIRF